MDPLALIEDYLSDNENGMKTLITGFLNQVMLAEALQQAMLKVPCTSLSIDLILAWTTFLM